MNRKSVYAVIVVFVTMVAVGLLNVAYTNHIAEQRVVDQQRAQRAARDAARVQSCELVAAFDDLYRETPPSTPAGVRVAEVWARYRAQLRC